MAWLSSTESQVTFLIYDFILSSISISSSWICTKTILEELIEGKLFFRRKEERIESKISLGEITRTRNEVTILPTSELYFSESIGLKKIFDFTRRKIVELWYFLNTNINTILHLLSNRRRITHTKKWEKIMNCKKYRIHLEQAFSS